MDKYAIKYIFKKRNNRVYRFPIGVLARNVETDSNHQFLTNTEKQNLLNAAGNTVEFETVAAERKFLQSGSRPGKLFPQINEWLKALKNVSFTGSYTDLLNKPNLGTAASKNVSNSTEVTQDGYVADARVIKTVNDKFGGMSLVRKGSDIYAVYTEGADTVQKKLGSVLEGLKKIVLQIVDVSASVQADITKITSENDGNTIRYTVNVNGTGNAAYPYSAKEIDYEVDGYKRKWTVDYEYNIKSFFPDDYKSWTAENFYFCINNSKVDCWHAPDNNVGPPRELKRSYKYNPSTGILVVKDVAAGTNENWGDADPNGTRGGHVFYNVSDCELLIIS